ncbi:hypothetical protein K2Z84_18785 [Candidatus Binatia bacterium]|nr:hypothetical protein [Candidatus Binatia bacterium]
MATNGAAGRNHEILRYLATGDYDPRHAAWPGNVFESGHAARRDLTDALIARVAARRRARTRPAVAPVPSGDELRRFTRAKLAPMVCGLFPRVEHEAVLAALETSVVILTEDNIEAVLRESAWLHTSWTLANLYLGSIGGDLLADDAPRIVGLSEETTCYVSTEYFRETDKFADFIVHEAAHIFHNCKRRTVGLREGRYREFLLEIAFRKRETFAYACEAWSRILELSKRAATRIVLVEEFAAQRFAPDERVDSEELADILREAARARNGWRRILNRCAPPPVARRRVALRL